MRIIIGTLRRKLGPKNSIANYFCLPLFTPIESKAQTSKYLKLTTDKYALRFLAPAGITGLWQVEKRGKGEMSEEERLMLDNVYAKNHSFLNDIKLMFVQQADQK